jgi:hypothetical protein
MTFDLRHELDQLATKVDHHPLMELMSYEVNPPASADLVRDVQNTFGSTIPEPVLNLYRNLNGGTLRWRFRQDLDDAQQRQIIAEFTPMTNAPQYAFDVAGAFELVPLDDALLHEDYTLSQVEYDEGGFVFDGATYSDNEFCAMLRIFDAVNDDSAMAFVAQPDLANWKLMWLTDDWMSYVTSRVTWLDDYLRLTIATWGLITARDKLFGEYEGYKQPPVIFDPERAAALVPGIMSAT